MQVSLMGWNGRKSFAIYGVTGDNMKIMVEETPKAIFKNSIMS